MIELMNIKEAGIFLNQNLPNFRRTASGWVTYLKKNLKEPQRGYRITMHILDGNPAYTKSALMQFVRVTTGNTTSSNTQN